MRTPDATTATATDQNSAIDQSLSAARMSGGLPAMTRRAEKSLETRTRILDAAEELFSRHGLGGVTLRDIAQMAEVDTALLHYYFDSKSGIFEAVLVRRAAIFNYETVGSLAHYETAAGDRLTVEGIVAAYLKPIFRLGKIGGREWRNYCALVLQHGNSSEWARQAVAEYFDPITFRFIAMLKTALPSASEPDLHWSYQLLSRTLALAFTLDDGIERLSLGQCRAGDFDALEPRMVAFVAAGVLAACTRRAGADN